MSAVRVGGSERELRQIAGTGVSLRGDDIDTDRIIPARFLKSLSFDALGEHAFEDDRRALESSGGMHPFDAPEHAGAAVLLVGSNFGCGSSREHAPQALYRRGIRAVAGESFAEIFFGNSATIGLPCVTLSRDDAAEARALVEADPDLEVTIDLEHRELRAGERTWPVAINESLRQRFVSGTWDTLGELSSAADRIEALAARLPYLNGWQQPSGAERS